MLGFAGTGPNIVVVSLLVAAAAIVAMPSAAVRFYLDPGSRRCFTEELPSNTQIIGDVRVASGKNNMEIDTWITTMSGHVVYHKRGADHGKFSFVTTPIERNNHSGIDDDDGGDAYGFEDETYRVCFEHQNYAGVVYTDGAKRSIFFRLDGTLVDSDSRVSSIAWNAKTDILQEIVHTMHESLSIIIGELSHLQRRERILVKHVTATSNGVIYLASLSITIAISTSIVHFQNLRTFFMHKKLC
jgi:emp24/gp25L/p24 family/GOLD